MRSQRGDVAGPFIFDFSGSMGRFYFSIFFWVSFPFFSFGFRAVARGHFVPRPTAAHSTRNRLAKLGNVLRVQFPKKNSSATLFRLIKPRKAR